jgi:hypothetical protein
MGAGASVPSTLDQLDSSAIAELVSSVGSDYIQYKEIFSNHGLSGDVLARFKTEEALHSCMNEVGIRSITHQHVLITKIQKLLHNEQIKRGEDEGVVPILAAGQHAYCFSWFSRNHSAL